MHTVTLSQPPRDADPARLYPSPAPAPTLPWWRVGMVWLVIGGPLVVVIAALFTAVLAVRGADPVLGGEAGGRTAPTRAGALAPAMQARNHAAKPNP